MEKNQKILNKIAKIEEHQAKINELLEEIKALIHGDDDGGVETQGGGGSGGGGTGGDNPGDPKGGG